MKTGRARFGAAMKSVITFDTKLEKQEKQEVETRTKAAAEKPAQKSPIQNRLIVTPFADVPVKIVKNKRCNRLQ